jgi:CheY-like chemotaxis protein
VESEIGVGTTFRVVLPASSMLPGSERRAPTPMLTSRARAVPRVLVVDDDPLVLRALQRGLSGFDVRVAAGGEAALAALDTDPPDLVLCDMLMPDLSGEELHARVRGRSHELADRFVFMTGGMATEHARAFLDAVPNARIEKPFSAVEVASLLRTLLVRPA